MAEHTPNRTTELIDAIIHCAATNFKKYGVRKTTIDETALSLHISKKTLYTYFP